MRTARPLPHRGVSVTEVPLERDPPGQSSPRQGPPWTETTPDRDPLDRNPPGQKPPPGTENETPVDRQTPVKTLPYRNQEERNKNILGNTIVI